MNDLKKKHGAKIDITTAKTTDKGAAEDIKESKLVSHGIVARDKNKKLITIVSGHMYGKDKVDAVIDKILAAAK